MHVPESLPLSLSYLFIKEWHRITEIFWVRQIGLFNFFLLFWVAFIQNIWNLLTANVFSTVSVLCFFSSRYQPSAALSG